MEEEEEEEEEVEEEEKRHHRMIRRHTPSQQTGSSFPFLQPPQIRQIRRFLLRHFTWEFSSWFFTCFFFPPFLALVSSSAPIIRPNSCLGPSL